MLSADLQRPAPRPRLLTPVNARIAPLFCLLLLTVTCMLASSGVTFNSCRAGSGII